MANQQFCSEALLESNRLLCNRGSSRGHFSHLTIDLRQHIRTNDHLWGFQRAPVIGRSSDFFLGCISEALSLWADHFSSYVKWIRTRCADDPQCLKNLCIWKCQRLAEAASPPEIRPRSQPPSPGKLLSDRTNSTRHDK